MRRAATVFAWCVALAASCGQQDAAGADGPGPVPRAQLERWIANDEAALRGPARTSPGAYGAHVASLLNELWLAHRDAELARRLATVGARLPGASDDRADARFFRGDRGAAFDVAVARHTALRDARTVSRTAGWAAVIERLRGIREGAHPDGRSIDAALVEGDVYAACGRFRNARITWYRAFSTSVVQPAQRYRFFPAWTSAMRRLLRYRSASDRPWTSVGCTTLPPPVVDPIA
ncbi:MAG TPA: hypothetical protein VGU66_03430 [Candidatus Elarobacter sp.]|nr:hypothetical protein [Candidatus Elarobacter sp.]